MNKLSLPVAISISLLAFGITDAASAHSRCDGDFESVNGNWIATRYCQRQVANAIAHNEHMRVSQRPSRSNEMTPDEYCRWHAADIRTQTYCSSYND
jgi:hypothetical protein